MLFELCEWLGFMKCEDLLYLAVEGMPTRKSSSGLLVFCQIYNVECSTISVQNNNWHWPVTILNYQWYWLGKVEVLKMCVASVER